MTAYHGACHCGAVTVDFHTDLDPRTIDVRACQCSFCTRHGAKTVSDADGLLVVTAPAEMLHRYRFATGTLDIVSCRVCATYVVATMAVDGGLNGVVNATGCGMDVFAARDARAVDYTALSADERIAARTIHWMPIEIRDGTTAS